MNRCPSCGTENRLGARFCSKCGSALQEQAKQSGGQPPTADTETVPGQGQTGQDPSQTNLGPQEQMADVSELERNTLRATTAMDADPSETTAADAPPPLEIEADPNSEASLPLSDAQVPSEEVASTKEQKTTATDHFAKQGTTDVQPPVSGDAGERMESLSIQETSADVARPESSVSHPQLEIGMLIAGRYRIIGLLAEGPDHSYQVEDLGTCPACGEPFLSNEDIINDTEMSQNVDHETFCDHCGADLRAIDLPWPTLVLRQASLSKNGASTDAQLSVGDHVYELVEDRDTELPNGISEDFGRGVHLVAAQRSHAGMVRTERPDEDSIFSLSLCTIHEAVADPSIGLYMVADGMGGHGDGEVASRLTIQTIAQHLIQTVLLPILYGSTPDPNIIKAQMEKAIETANHRVRNEAQTRNSDMGNTVTLAVVINEVIYVSNVGDSRAYLWDRTGLQQITEDHSTVYRLVKEGILDEEGIYTHPERSVIYRSLGAEPHVEVDHFQMSLTPDNLLVLCCDGLWEMLHNDGIADVLMALGLTDPQTICDELVRRANQAGGEDNISVVVVRAAA